MGSGGQSLRRPDRLRYRREANDRRRRYETSREPGDPFRRAALKKPAAAREVQESGQGCALPTRPLQWEAKRVDREELSQILERLGENTAETAEALRALWVQALLVAGAICETSSFAHSFRVLQRIEEKRARDAKAGS